MTPVGALPSPALALAWVTESVKATRRRPVPATYERPEGEDSDWGQATSVTLAVKSGPRSLPSLGTVT